MNILEAPVNSRLLAKRHEYSSDIFEIRVLEWSPSGTRVSVRYDPSGSQRWFDAQETKYLFIVEHLWMPTEEELASLRPSKK